MFKLLAALQKYTKKKVKLFKRFADPSTVFIYQMGKVGSTTLEHSIDNALHIHAFYSENSTCVVRQKGLNKFGFKSFFYNIEFKLTNVIQRVIFKNRASTKIITLVREPIARNQSMFFHDLDAYLFSAHTNCINSRKKPLPTRSQPKCLLEQVFNEEFDHYYPSRWFDHEFKPMTGIDVYSHEFDKGKGFSIIEQKGISVLCIRTDKLNLLTPEIEKFLGKKVVIVNDNSAEDKWYSDLYNQFKQYYKLPVIIEKNIQESPFYQHFFD